jgi:hypothetical protein
MALASQIAELIIIGTCLAHIGHTKITLRSSIDEQAIRDRMIAGEGDHLINLLNLLGLDVYWGKRFVWFLNVPQIDFGKVGRQKIFLIVGLADGVDAGRV